MPPPTKNATEAEAPVAQQDNKEASLKSASSSEDEGMSDEPVERELLDQMADQKQLDARFTRKQLDYLNEHRDSYRYGSANQRRELAQATGDHFLKKLLKVGRDPSKDKIAAMYDNVKLWYAQRARSRTGPMHWTIHWNGRMVFYKENTELVLDTQKKLFELETGVKCREESVSPVDLELVGEDSPTVQPGRGPKLFHFFQRAISAEWMRLTDKERASYDAKALAWRERGPSVEERRRLAEKESGRVIHQFADEIYRQMGVRLHFLVSFEDTTGEHLAFSLDFNNQIDGGVSFKQAERGYLGKIDLENYWAGFVRRHLPEEGAPDPEAPINRPRKRGEPVPIELNSYNEPIVPSLQDLPNSVKAHKYFPDLIRSIMRHDYACARDLPISDTDTSPPWKEMSGAWNKWISEEYWPKDWPVGDPGNYGVPKCRTILQTWFERQERGEIPFQFHSYWVGGEEWLPREPRRDARRDTSDDEPTKKKRRGKKRKNTKSKSNAKSRPARSTPKSTASQSASVAMNGARATSAPPGTPLSPQPSHDQPSPLSTRKAPPADSAPAPGDRAPELPQHLSTPPPLSHPPKDVGRSKSRAIKSRTIAESSSDSDTSLAAADQESEPDTVHPARKDTPRTKRLVGATKSLTLRTPSREGSWVGGQEADREGRNEVNEVSEREKESEVEEEREERAKRASVRIEKQAQSRVKAEQRKSQGKPRKDADLEVDQDGDRSDGRVDDRMEVTDGRDFEPEEGEAPIEIEQRAPGGRGKGRDRGGDQKGRGGRTSTRGRPRRGGVSGDGSGTSTCLDNVEVNNLSMGEGTKKVKESPQDRLLLEAAERHLPTSAKRPGKKVVRFGEEAPAPSVKSRGRR